MEGLCCRWIGQIWLRGISLRTFVMSVELFLINLFTAVDTVFDTVILIDGVVQDDFTFVEFSLDKEALAYNCAIGEHGWFFGTSGVAMARAEQAGWGLLCHPLNTVGFHSLSWLVCGHPLNCCLRHSLTTLGVET